eukprot:CAMPEP_0118645246 /NCGR_PEP_ID=MMETSP0785-20121206/7394_1 /TAXON_ID=91992 /ORGANISM="Bolidomonas pacifica, Strain CCMP 1866" /LENGTH=49 /DNA_ID=CAMNT_0006537107 /DNA_START=94 /DNA_END=243 /DNA_ORIENTATION=-
MTLTSFSASAPTSWHKRPPPLHQNPNPTTNSSLCVTSKTTKTSTQLRTL